MPDADPLVIYYDQWDVPHQAPLTALPGRTTATPCPTCGQLVRATVRDLPTTDLALHQASCPAPPPEEP